MITAVRNSRKGLLKSARALDDVDGAFRSHADAARFLVDMGILRNESRPHLVAFGAGGLAVAKEIADASGLEVSFAAVSELSPAWLGGPIFGAAAFDGTVVVDEVLKEVCSVSREQFQSFVEDAYGRVANLVDQGDEDAASFPDLGGRTAIVVDDGLSSPISIRAAIAAVRNARATRVVLALPLGHRRAVLQLAELVDLTYCASLRTALQGPLVGAYGRGFPLLAARTSMGRTIRRQATAS